MLDVNQKSQAQVTFNSQGFISVKQFIFGGGKCNPMADSGLTAGGQHSKDFAQALADVFQF